MDIGSSCATQFSAIYLQTLSLTRDNLAYFKAFSTDQVTIRCSNGNCEQKIWFFYEHRHRSQGQLGLMRF